MSSYIEYVHARADYDDILKKLAEGNRFSHEDLVSNRAGRLSMGQLQIHLKETLTAPLLLLAAGVLVSFLTRVAFAAYVEKQNILTYTGTLLGQLLMFKLDKFREMYLTTAGEHLPLLTGLFVVAAPATAYKKLRYINIRLIIDVLVGRVKSVDGTPWATSEEKRAPGGKKGEMIDIYYYVFKDFKIEVCRTGFKAFTDGVRCKAYYLPLSKMLVSIEPVVNA